MTKNKTKFLFIFMLLLIFPICFIFSACKEDKTVERLYAEFNPDLEVQEFGNTVSINKTYGDTEYLESLKVFARYTDCTSKELSQEEYSLNIMYMPLNYNEQSSQKTYAEYCEKVEASNLDAGTWELEFGFSQNLLKISIYVERVESQETYFVDITDKTNHNLFVNTLYYGAKSENAYEIKVVDYEMNVLSENLYDKTLYVLNESETYDPNITPKQYYDMGKLSYFQMNSNETKPGNYWVCLKVNAFGNYNQKFTCFTYLKILKSKFEINSQNLTLNYTFDASNKKIENLTFEDMQTNNGFGSSVSFSGGKLILNSDGDQTNTDILDSSNKLTSEEIISDFSNFGSFVPVNANAQYNAIDNNAKAMFKFVPSNEEYFLGKPYSFFFDESKPFEVTLNISKGKVSVPYVGNGFGVYDANYQTYLNHKVGLYNQFIDIRYFASENNVYDIQTNTTKQNSSEQGEITNSFFTNSAGNFYVKFVLKNANFEWLTTDAKTDNYAYTRQIVQTDQTQNGYVLFNWTIEKADIQDLFSASYEKIQNANYEIQTNVCFDSSGVANLRFGNYDCDNLLSGINLNWEVLPQNYNIENVGQSTATGVIETLDGKENNTRFKKFVLNCEGVDKDSSILVAFHISSNGNENLNAFDEYILLQFDKFDYRTEDDIVQTMEIETENGTFVFYYKVINSGITLEELINNFPQNLGTFELKNHDNTEIEDMSKPISNKDSFVLYFNSNTCYAKSLTDSNAIYLTIFFQTPTQSDFNVPSF